MVLFKDHLYPFCPMFITFEKLFLPEKYPSIILSLPHWRKTINLLTSVNIIMHHNFVVTHEKERFTEPMPLHLRVGLLHP